MAYLYIPRSYGRVPQVADPRDYVFIPHRAVSVPASFDVRSLISEPLPYDQGQLGSCTANMAAYMYQYCALRESLPFTGTPSRLFIYYNERMIDGDVNSDSGAQCRDGLKVMGTYGIIPETELPYNIAQYTVKPTPQMYTDALKDLALEYVAVSPQDVKAAISSGYPVGFGFTVYNSFESESTALTGIMTMPTWWERITNQVAGGHAVVRVGYYDNSVLPMILKNGAVLKPHSSGGYYIVRNSWSPKWGDAGYFYMPYGNDQYSSDFWVLHKVGEM